MLYTALHHAREPNSLSQMIFYIWYLLENYETDAEVKYLVDNTAMYFIPVINPDGYVYNETTETPDHETFLALSSVMTQENDFFAGTGTETVGYTVNGNSDDWIINQEFILADNVADQEEIRIAVSLDNLVMCFTLLLLDMQIILKDYMRPILFQPWTLKRW